MIKRLYEHYLNLCINTTHIKIIGPNNNATRKGRACAVQDQEASQTEHKDNTKDKSRSRKRNHEKHAERAEGGRFLNTTLLGVLNVYSLRPTILVVLRSPCHFSGGVK